jgi:hypothetical protein
MEKTAQQPDSVNLRELRFLLSLPDQSLRKLFTLKLSRDDCSFYLFPHSAKDEYYFGVEIFPAGEKRLTFNFTGQHVEAKRPKVSFHPNGSIKIAGIRVETPMVEGAPFSTLRGQHVATVRVDGLSAAPVHTNAPVIDGPRRDAVTPLVGDVPSLRIVICANSVRDAFDKDSEVTGGVPWMLPIWRPSEKLFLGFYIIDNSDSSTGTGTGTTVITGWDPRHRTSGEMRFLFLRAS